MAETRECTFSQAAALWEMNRDTDFQGLILTVDLDRAGAGLCLTDDVLSFKHRRNRRFLNGRRRLKSHVFDGLRHLGRQPDNILHKFHADFLSLTSSQFFPPRYLKKSRLLLLRSLLPKRNAEIYGNAGPSKSA